MTSRPTPSNLRNQTGKTNFIYTADPISHVLLRESIELAFCTRDNLALKLKTNSE